MLRKNRLFAIFAVVMTAGLLSDILSDSLEPCPSEQSQDCAASSCHSGGCQFHFGATAERGLSHSLIEKKFIIVSAVIHIPQKPVRRQLRPPIQTA
ncbi:MAG: hypothetical protein A2901_04395 [Elusimicrobia bacterium RIFCSPLOWO2_01_FULL_54_10]|nr:MAG: hypothetical protein A2901_04395 [Elusimicrobia bacterium RIFCSPLOWO2_01_FULL_54_10]